MHSEELGESMVERLIREAIEAGEFDNLRGQGQPIPGAGRKDDDLWWFRDWLRRTEIESPAHRASD